MPRKKPDLTPFYPDKKKRIDGVCANAPYFNIFSHNTVWAVKDSPKDQRMVKCQDCGTIIPRNIPRIWLESPYRNGAGHWCISCGRGHLASMLKEFRDHKDRVQTYIDSMENLLDTIKNIDVDQRYIDVLAMGKMLSVMRGKSARERKY